MSESSSISPTRGKTILLAAARVALILTALTQTILVPGFLFPFVSVRNIYFRICVEVALAVIVLIGVRRLRDVTDSDPVLKALFGFVIVLGISATFGLSPLHSLFGDFERMGGVWAWFHLFLFYLALRVLLGANDWIIYFRVMVFAALIVVAWGAGEFLPGSIRNPHFQTTLTAGSMVGNPGLLAPYLLLCAFLCAWLLIVESRPVWKALAASSGLVLLFGIAGARNRSSELGLTVGIFVGAATYFVLHRDRRRLVRRYLVAGVTLVAVGLGIALLLKQRAPDIAEHFGGRWVGFVSSPVDHSRTVEWNIALQGFRDRPILGYGPENHQIVASHHFDPRIYQILGDEVFDRTHNAWLELLATTGIVGTLAMIGVWVALMLTIRKGIQDHSLSAAEAAIFLAALSAYAVYLTFWFFDINSVVVWVALAGFISSRVYGPLLILAEPGFGVMRSVAGRVRTGAIVGLIALSAYLHGIVPLIAAHDLSTAAGGGPFELRLAAFRRVMNSAVPQTLHTFPLYFRFLRSTSPYAMDPGAPAPFRREFDLALQRGMIEADRTISRNRQDDRSYADAARFSMLAGSFYGDTRYLVLARNELLTAIRISPRRPDARVLLSSLYSVLHDSVKSRAQLDSAMKLAPQYGGSFYFAGKTAIAQNNPDSAAALLRLSLSKKFRGTTAVYLSVISSLEQRREYLPAARLAQALLEAITGPMADWRRANAARPLALEPTADTLANRLPILYLKGGDASNAVATAIAYGLVNPTNQPAVSEFVADVRSGAGARWTTKPALVADIQETVSSTASRSAK